MEKRHSYHIAYKYYLLSFWKEILVNPYSHKIAFK